MPNWNTTTYVFASNEKAVIEDFHEKLQKWLKEPSSYPKAFDGTPAWLGNILLRAGFGSLSDPEHIAPCRYRGTLDYVCDSIEEGISGGETLYFFHILTYTAWTEMPVMWQLIINKLYPGNTIRFAFSTELELSEYRATYNHELLSLIGIDQDQRYWLDCYVEGDVKAPINILACVETGVISAEVLAELFSDVLQKEITISDITDSARLEDIVSKINTMLEMEDPNFYLNVYEVQTSNPKYWE